MLTQSELKKLLSYDPETGDFAWIVGKRAGKKAGSNLAGYLVIKISGKKYLAHRLAWLYVYDKIPASDIDHINRIKNANWIKNLRECSRTENLWNIGISQSNTSGFKGVSWCKQSGKWRARILIYGKSNHLGLFTTAESASEAYNSKALNLHGEFYLSV